MAEAKLVEYDFNINYTHIDMDGRGAVPVITVNNQFPGPMINVTYMDRLVIRLRNHLPSEGVSLHFHGFEMRGEAYKYDGAHFQKFKFCNFCLDFHQVLLIFCLFKCICSTKNVFKI